MIVMPEMADIVYYDTNPVRPYVDYYCPIVEDVPEENEAPDHVLVETPTLQRTIIASPRAARVRPYVFTYTTAGVGEQLTLPLASRGEISHTYTEVDPLEEEYSPERLERLATAHEEARQHSGGFQAADPALLKELIKGLKRL